MIRWYWKVKVGAHCLFGSPNTKLQCVPVVYFVAAVLATIMSLLLLWSEVFFFVESPTLSLIANIVLPNGVASNVRFVTIE